MTWFENPLDLSRREWVSERVSGEDDASLLTGRPGQPPGTEVDGLRLDLRGDGRESRRASGLDRRSSRERRDDRLPLGDAEHAEGQRVRGCLVATGDGRGLGAEGERELSLECRGGAGVVGGRHRWSARKRRGAHGRAALDRERGVDSGHAPPTIGL